MSNSNRPIGNKSVLLDIEGMKCGGCVHAVEQTLLSQPGVINASVNLITRTAWLDIHNADQDIDPILKDLADRGFPAQPRETNLPAQELINTKGWWNQWKPLMVAFIASIDSTILLY